MAEENVKALRVVPDSPLFNTDNMFYKKFPSDLRQIRYFALVIVQKAPSEIQEINLLEQQISELLKNAVKHGNGMDPKKSVEVWYSFSPQHAHLIVQDEGEGFKELERWNEFNRKRLACLHEQNFEELANYVAFTTEKSEDTDGGNAMFAAIEYWDRGLVFNEQRNGVAVYRNFQRKEYGRRIG